MAAHDASAVALIGHMNEMERQRRVLSMMQREQEAKVAFATAEKEKLAQLGQTMAAEEAQLKRSLEALATEQQQLELQKMEATDRLRKTQAAEVLHMSAAEADVQALEKESASWQARAAELEALRCSWESDAVMSACIASLRREGELLASVKAGKAAVDTEAAAVAARVETVRAEQQAHLASAARAGSAAVATGNAPSPLVASLAATPYGEGADGAAPDAPAAAATATAAAMAEEIKRADYEAAQQTTRHARTMAALQREVDALSVRAAELQQLFSTVEASRQELQARARDLQRCRASCLCRRCIAS